MTCIVDGCDAQGRLLPRGPMCPDHLPAQPTPDPALTLTGLRAAAQARYEAQQRHQEG